MSQINGARPSPLKINKESHLIQKSSFSSSSSSNSSFTNVVAAATKHHQHQQRHHPVIIYTHSPKIIHTQARDFMALVQKLTGLSRSEDSAVQLESQEKGQASSLERNNEGSNKIKGGGYDNSGSSSVVTKENCRGGRVDIQVNSSSISPVFDPLNPFSDIPLFTPNSTDFFCSPGSFYKYSDSVFTPPSVLGILKGFSEY